MRTARVRRWVWYYVLPTLALSISFSLPTLVFWEDFGVEATNGLMLLGWFVVGPLLAFLTGLIVRPPHIWLPPAAALAILCTIVAVNEGVGEMAEVTVAFVVFLILPWTFLVWAGKAIRRRLGERVTARRHHRPPAAA